MKAFLMSLKSFSVSIGGLIVVIIAVLLYGNVLSIIRNFPPFSLAIFGSYLALFVLMFAVVWAQLKSNALLSHGILFFLFASAISGFLSQLFSNTPANAFELDSILDVVIMLYTLGVVAAFVLYDKPKPAKLSALATLPFLVYLGAHYLYAGFGVTLLSLLVVVIALLLGSKVVALAYAIFSITTPLFSNLHLIFQAFSNDTPQVVNYWFGFAVLTVAFVFLILEFVKSIKLDQA